MKLNQSGNRKKWTLLAVVFFMSLAGAGASALSAHAAKRSGNDSVASVGDPNDGLESPPAPGRSVLGGPGEVPTPFEVNQLVDLADGEEYLLLGRLVSQRSGRILFRVDLQQHPWLATRRRLSYPFYAIENSNVSLGRFVDSDIPVRMRVMARTVVVGSCTTPAVVLRLVPVAEPVPASIPIRPEEVRYRGTFPRN